MENLNFTILDIAEFPFGKSSNHKAQTYENTALYIFFHILKTYSVLIVCFQNFLGIFVEFIQICNSMLWKSRLSVTYKKI